MKKLKLNNIEKNNLTNKEMISINGGNSCGCSCWDGTQSLSASFVDNGQSNYNGNKQSIQGYIYGAYIPEVVVKP